MARDEEARLATVAGASDRHDRPHDLPLCPVHPM